MDELNMLSRRCEGVMASFMLDAAHVLCNCYICNAWSINCSLCSSGNCLL